MSGQFGPGDVALVTDVAGEVRPMILIGHDPANRCWHGAMSNGDIRCLLAGQEQDTRPLLVIDVEDREQVERLDSAYQSALDACPAFHSLADVMQTAVRSLLPTPKPDEPQGLGAVVLDAEGMRWVRTEWSRPWEHKGIAEDWRDINAVEVLSEGWSE